MLRALPPGASRCSYTVTEKPRSASSCAALSPATPPPSTATVVMGGRYCVPGAHVRLSRAAPRAAAPRTARGGLPLLRRRGQPRGDHPGLARLPDRHPAADRDARGRADRVPAAPARRAGVVADADRGVEPGGPLRGRAADRALPALAP